MSDDFRVPSGRRTWRPPLSYRVALTLVVSVLVGAAAGYSWVTLSSNQLHGEVVLAVAVPLWALFAFRIWTVSATLSQDTLVIRNVLSTERVLVADITRVAFSGRILKVTERRPPLPLGPSPVTALGAAFPRHRDSGQRYAVSAVQLGLMASISGSRCEADDAAGLIAAVAGLPALPERGTDGRLSGSLLMIPAGIAGITFGTVLSDKVLPGPGHPIVAGVFNGIGVAGVFIVIRGLIADRKSVV